MDLKENLLVKVHKKQGTGQNDEEVVDIWFTEQKNQ